MLIAHDASTQVAHFLRHGRFSADGGLRTG
jgi:hypothetical protein